MGWSARPDKVFTVPYVTVLFYTVPKGRVSGRKLPEVIYSQIWSMGYEGERGDSDSSNSVPSKQMYKYKARRLGWVSYLPFFGVRGGKT